MPLFDLGVVYHGSVKCFTRCVEVPADQYQPGWSINRKLIDWMIYSSDCVFIVILVSEKDNPVSHLIIEITADANERSNKRYKS